MLPPDPTGCSPASHCRFTAASSFDQDISTWDTSSVVDMSGMFKKTDSFSNLDRDMAAWDTSSVTNMDSMFEEATGFRVDITGWSTPALTDFDQMFAGATAWLAIFTRSPPSASQDGPPSAWAYDVNRALKVAVVECVTAVPSGNCPCDGNGCSRDPRFSGVIGSWDVSDVSDMHDLFSTPKSGSCDIFCEFDGEISAWDTSRVTNMDSAFSHASRFNRSLSAWDTSSVDTMYAIFREATAFNGDVSAWDTSRVTELSKAFAFARFFDRSLSGWHTASVTSANEMLRGATAFDGDIATWDTSSVTYLHGFLYEATSFSGSLAHWDTSQARHMGKMFHLATSFPGGVLAWDTSSVTSCDQMFAKATSFSGDVSGWDVSAVSGMDDLFESTAFNGSVSAWDTSSVVNASLMFSRTPFSGDLSRWDTSSLQRLSGMFYQSRFDGDVSTWDTSSAISLWGTFADCSFGGPISSWDTSSVTAMLYTFAFNDRFDGDLSAWDVSNVDTLEGVFQRASAFAGDVAFWDTSSVTSLRGAFSEAVSFNGSLAGWDVSRVATFAGTFEAAAAFDRNLSGWDTSSGVLFDDMFAAAAAFDQSIASWDTGAAANLTNMFLDAARYLGSHVRIAAGGGAYDGPPSGWALRCPAGTADAFPGAGLPDCVRCAPGNFSDRRSAAACEQCPAGSTTVAYGSSSCTPCAALTNATGCEATAASDQVASQRTAAMILVASGVVLFLLVLLAARHGFTGSAGTVPAEAPVFSRGGGPLAGVQGLCALGILPLLYVLTSVYYYAYALFDELYFARSGDDPASVVGTMSLFAGFGLLALPALVVGIHALDTHEMRILWLDGEYGSLALAPVLAPISAVLVGIWSAGRAADGFPAGLRPFVSLLVLPVCMALALLMPAISSACLGFKVYALYPALYFRIQSLFEWLCEDAPAARFDRLWLAADADARRRRQKVRALFLTDDADVYEDSMTAAAASTIALSTLLLEFVVGGLIGLPAAIVANFENDGWCWDECEYSQAMFATAAAAFAVQLYAVMEMVRLGTGVRAWCAPGAPKEQQASPVVNQSFHESPGLLLADHDVGAAGWAAEPDVDPIYVDHAFEYRPDSSEADSSEAEPEPLPEIEPEPTFVELEPPAPRPSGPRRVKSARDTDRSALYVEVAPAVNGQFGLSRTLRPASERNIKGRTFASAPQ